MLRSIVLFLVLSLVAGCQSNLRRANVIPTTQESIGLAQQEELQTVQAAVDPPAGWRPEPLKSDGKHQHQVWLSPTGRTAYGVIYFPLPLPASPDFVFPFFMNAMKKDQGEAVLLHKEKDPDRGSLRFDVEGGLYRMRVNLLTSGWKGWAVYAGTLRNQPIESKELDLAEKAREYTRVGLSSG